MGEIPPLSPAEVGGGQNRVVGGDTGPRVPHTTHVFGDRKKTVDLGVSLVVWGL